MRQGRDHFISEELAEHIVGRAAARAAGRDHSDRGAQVFGQIAALDYRLFAGRADTERTHRLLHVLDVALAQIFDVGIERRRQLVAHVGRNDDLVRPRERGQAGGQVDTVAVDVVFVGDQRADVHADAQVQLALWCNVDICVHRCFLHRERDADGRVRLAGTRASVRRRGS